MLLEGRAAFVTGGAGRIGRAVAAALLREGARVAVGDVRSDLLSPAVTYLGHFGRPVVALHGDLSDAATIVRLADEAEAAIGPIDLLVTCAAVYPNIAVLEMDTEGWDRVFAVNVRGVMLVAQIFARRWIARDVAGAIVNLSSGAARSARRGGAAYCGSKAALEMMGDVLATELGPHGIRVNTVAPGLVTDEPVDATAADVHPYYAAMLEATPLGRTGAPGDIAEAVVFLLSDRSQWTTGARLEITGGSHCGRTHVPFTTSIERR